ncbi:DNA-deoxyinosine glycosylase [Candidatus Avelusimicrobium alvi]|uniref:DNA-deoxyinosine glycosylase n=1 Tax=Candidatus Avelusimicrobium alvi TaxID=3416221 RepID=UPI003D0DDB6B
MIHSFPPCADEHTRILIVGSMPGGASLKAGEYYAYKHNQFWRLMFDLLAAGRTPESYRDKLNTLLIHHIGLWDALESCERKGSLDGSITRPHPNDFPSLFKRFPAIRTLLFNGQAARTHFKRAFGEPAGKNCITLPSTSPAHASRSYEEKKALWRAALKLPGTGARP